MKPDGGSALLADSHNVWDGEQVPHRLITPLTFIPPKALEEKVAPMTLN